MSAGYISLAVVFFLVAFVVCLLVYYYYTKVSIKRIPVACVVWHVIALYMCVLPFPLLVIDVDAALSAQQNDTAKQTWMKPVWITIFAVTYFCGWITLPLCQMYTEVGAFEWRKALLDSLKKNLKVMAIIIGIVAIFFVYIVIAKSAYSSVASILKIGISLANSWGLLMLILFMPAGLVGVPRLLYRYADAKRLLRRFLYDAMNIQEDLDLAAMDLAAIKAELMSIDPLVSDTDRPHLQHMLELISEADRDIPMYRIAAQRVKSTPSQDRHDMSLVHLEELHARLKCALKIVNRTNYRWSSTVRKCDSLDQIIRGVKGTNNPVKKIWFSIRRYVYWLGCGVCSILTILILWSELVLPFGMLTTNKLGVIELVMHSPVHFPASIVLLFYMGACAYWAAFQFKVFDVYVVYPSIADNASLCFNETFLVRLLMPLCFNFLLISGFSSDSTDVDVMYGHVYRRNMDVSALFGEVANRFLPLLIPFISTVVFFNLTQRVLSLVGVEIHNSNDVDSPAVRQRLEDGRKLVENELGHELVSAALPGGDIVNGHMSHPMAQVAGGPEGRGQRYREYLEKKKSQEGGDTDAAV